MQQAVHRAALKISNRVKSDHDLDKEIGLIARSFTRKELMPAFLNLRLSLNPQQVFRVLDLKEAETEIGVATKDSLCGGGTAAMKSK